MENKSHALVAGIFVIVLLTATVLIGVWFSRDRIETVPYQIATKLSITGLNEQAPVRYRGLEVGRVENISFDPEVPGQILVRIGVLPRTPITASTFATLGYQGVTGIAYIQLDDDGSQPVMLPSSPEDVARIEMRPSLFDQLQASGLAILEQTEEVVKRVNGILTPENQDVIVDAFESVNRAATQIETIPRQLQPVLAKLPAMATQAQETLASLDTLSENASTLTTTLNAMAKKLQAPGGTIAAITTTAEQVGAAADRIEEEIVPLAKDARGSLRALDRTLNRLSERPQSVLFGSPEVAPGPGEEGFAAPSR